MTYPMTIEEKPDIIKGLYLTPPKNQSQNLPQQVRKDIYSVQNYQITKKKKKK